MDINDFKGNFKYKLIVPIVYIVSWISLFVGPSFFQVYYQRICIYILLHALARLTLNMVYSIIAYVKANKTLNKAQTLNQLPLDLHQEISNPLVHLFVVPNYKEDSDLLSETLEQLAKHSWARQKYSVFLGMEAHEQSAQVKAEKLIQNYKHRFLHMGFTIHNQREFQQKGKASNVSWCVEHLQEIYFTPYKINPNLVMITVLDADSLVPEIYIHQVQDHLRQGQNLTNKETFIYTPNQIFSRNNHEVPAIVRTCDDLHASVHSANMISIFGISFPLSNYTISYQLLKQIGFWDTCADAIGEDYHTVLKTLWKGQRGVIGVPIYAPFNQVNICTGKGYLKDIQAKFWQTQRHSCAVAEVAYNFNMLEKHPVRIRALVALLQTIEVFLMPALLPWATLALVYQPLIISRFYKLSPELISYDYLIYVINSMTVVTFFIYFFYFLIKRRAEKVLYGRQPESWLRLLEFFVLIPINTFLIDVPCFVIGTMGSLFQSRQYVRADKVISKPS